MNARTGFRISTFAAAALLTACGGGAGGGSLPSAGGSTTAQSAQQQTEDAIGAANEIGSPLGDFTSFDASTASPAPRNVSRQIAGDGTCADGVEFFSPDKNGDPDSTERIDFYDNGCTAPARDTVRIFSSTGASSETVRRTVSFYALNAASPAAVRSETVNYVGASFDRFGYPVLAGGFARTHTGELSVNGVKTIDADGELIVAASTAGSTTFCSDSAGFNASGDAALGETFGWAGLMPNGTRTVNADGSVTWKTTHTGTTYTGPVGGLSIQAGAQNTSCPIATPMFTLAGGTQKGAYSLPVTATYLHGILTALSIPNATLPNGDTLEVQSSAGVSPGNSHFISGTLAKNGSTIATFNTDAFGDGVLIVAATGKQYAIEDWHVVKT